MKAIVITTINEKTRAIKSFEKFEDWKIILIGDKKSKEIKSTENVTFLSVEDQRKLDFEIVDKCPLNHYSRKNVGYLYALREGASLIYETDDDNIPYGNWSFPKFSCDNLIEVDGVFYNIYSYYSDEQIWPRGYPLDEIFATNPLKFEKKHVQIGVWQGIVDKHPDVDAIFRLVLNREVYFDGESPVALDKFLFCPFNSQNTLWSREMIPYAYLPVTTSFRFTDILRGYIAQRMMWEHDLYLGFTGANVYQERNEHDLMKDFKDEIDCYLCVKKVVEMLSAGDYSKRFCDNLLSVYEDLRRKGVVAESELITLHSWLSDLEMVL
jgi:hypothetical protein